MLSLKLEREARRPRDRARHALAYDVEGAPLAFGSRSEDGLWLEVPGIAAFKLLTDRADVLAFPRTPVDRHALLDAFYATVLPLAVQATLGLEVLHASAVLELPRDRVVAFCGMSGAGKSTLANGLVARGYGHWADDAVAFRVDRAHPVTAVGLPFLVKREMDSHQPSEVTNEFESSSARLASVFLLEPIDPKDKGEDVVQRVSPGNALRRLLQNAYRFQPQADARRRETLQSYLELVASVPIFTARFLRGLERLPELLDKLEEHIAALA